MNEQVTTVDIAVHGAGGRMGRQLIAAIAERGELALLAAIDAPGQSCIGLDAGQAAGLDAAGVFIGDSVDAAADAAVLVDFSLPAASIALLERLQTMGSSAAVVVGTTGFDAEQRERLVQTARIRPIVFAANYSIGVTLTLNLLRQAARALGDDYDVEISEAHHRHKVDAPSGTALAMGEVLADTLGRQLETDGVFTRHGITGARERRSIGFSVTRAGDIVGEHTVLFAGNGERVEITHRATDRMTFARGAIQAAHWVSSREPGLYDMSDVLGLSDS